VRLTIYAGADTFAEAAEKAVRYIADMEWATVACSIDRDAPGTSNGHSSGGCGYEIDVDPDAPAGEDYRRALREWADKRRREREGGSDGA
jgi:hypothetical protein